MNLQDIRMEIDGIDDRIIALLADRSAFVTAAGLLKKDEQGVRDSKRVEQVIDRVKMRAVKAGLDPGIAEQVYRTIIACFINKELKEQIRES